MSSANLRHQLEAFELGSLVQSRDGIAGVVPPGEPGTIIRSHVIAMRDYQDRLFVVRWDNGAITGQSADLLKPVGS